jgi:hypothetical protein
VDRLCCDGRCHFVKEDRCQRGHRSDN